MPELKSVWKILIVDDDDSYHTSAKQTLKNISYKNRTIEFLDAYSAEEAVGIIEKHPDIAIVLLDIVLETEHAGLHLIHRIRGDSNNRYCSIIVQAGEFVNPTEEELATQYEINGIITKSRSSDTRLKTVIITNLRAVETLRTVASTRRQFENNAYEMLIETMNEGIASVDLEENITFVNAVACKIFGYSKDELLKMNLRQLTTEEDFDKIRTQTSIRKQGDSGQYNLHIVKKSGEERILRLNATPLFSYDGLFQGTMAVFDDITEQKRAERALIESYERFETVLDSIEAIIYVADMDSYELLFVNKYTKDMMGDIVGSICWKALQKDKKGPCEFCTNKFLLEEGKPTGIYSWEFQNPVTNRWYHIQDRAIKWIDDRYVRLEIATDITKVKETEEALRESEEKFRFLAENTNDVIWVMDKNGRFRYISPAVEKLRGYTPEEVIQQKPEEMLTPDSLKKVEKAMAEVFAYIDMGQRQREAVTLDLQQPCKDGNVIWTEAVITLIFDDNGQFVFFLGASRDISKRRQVEEALRESEQQLREINASKDKFFSIIAHDIRNPLGVMIGYTDMLLSYYKEFKSKDILDSLTTINRASKELLNLLENLLTWARSQTGRIDFEPQSENLSFMVNDAIVLQKEAARAKQILLSADIDASLEVFVDEQMLKTILRNLLSNAIKFTREGGTVTISSKIVAEFVQVTVSDSGVGIEPGILDTLFRIDISHSTPGTNQEKGSGLGLILCKEFVATHGGDIWIESEVDVGSTFSFTIPRYKLQGLD